MINRALDSNNDLIVEKGTFKLVSDGAQVLQTVRCNLLFFLEEWFLDESYGIPYYEKIFTKPADLANIESIMKTAIIRSEGVERLTDFSMDYDNNFRTLLIAFSAETIYGRIERNEVTLNV